MYEKKGPKANVKNAQLFWKIKKPLEKRGALRNIVSETALTV